MDKLSIPTVFECDDPGSFLHFLVETRVMSTLAMSDAVGIGRVQVMAALHHARAVQ